MGNANREFPALVSSRNFIHSFTHLFNHSFKRWFLHAHWEGLVDKTSQNKVKRRFVRIEEVLEALQSWHRDGLRVRRQELTGLQAEEGG